MYLLNINFQQGSDKNPSFGIRVPTWQADMLHRPVPAISATVLPVQKRTAASSHNPKYIVQPPAHRHPAASLARPSVLRNSGNTKAPPAAPAAPLVPLCRTMHIPRISQAHNRTAHSIAVQTLPLPDDSDTSLLPRHTDCSAPDAAPQDFPVPAPLHIPTPLPSTKKNSTLLKPLFADAYVVYSHKYKRKNAVPNTAVDERPGLQLEIRPR